MEEEQSRSEPTKSPEICQFYKQGKCRFGEDCFNLHQGPCEQIKSAKKKSKAISRDESENSKKPMKTAEDVIKRIQWDEMLPPEAFTIGYLDRFVGIVEDEFTKFSNWGNIVSLTNSF